MLGPIDYIVVGFEGNNFDGSVLTQLTKAVDSGTIRVVDLLFVLKDSEGEVVTAEIADQSEDLQAVAASFGFASGMPLLAEQDVRKIGDMLDKNSSAAILVIEQLWAKGLKKALIDADGVLLDEGRIHADVVDDAVKELETTKA